MAHDNSIDERLKEIEHHLINLNINIQNFIPARYEERLKEIEKGLCDLFLKIQNVFTLSKLTQVMGEFQFIAKRISKMEGDIEKIKKEGIRKTVHLDFRCDGYELVKKTISHDPSEQICGAKEVLNEKSKRRLKNG